MLDAAMHRYDASIKNNQFQAHHLLAMTFFFNISASERKGAELPTPRQILYPRDKVRIGWKSSERKWVPGAGMINVGNTCYLNSTLQALFHVPALANWLISDYIHRETCEEKSEYHILFNSRTKKKTLNFKIGFVCF